MTEIIWLNWVIYIAACLTAAGVIWRKAIKPVVRGISVLEGSVPVLLEIAAEFKHDEKAGSESLKDILTRMEVGLKENTAKIEIITARQETQGVKLDNLHEYSHNTRHETLQELQKVKLKDEILANKIDKLVENSEQRRHTDPTMSDEEGNEL